MSHSHWPKPILLVLPLLALVVGSFFLVAEEKDPEPVGASWVAPDTSALSANINGELILYGRRLIVNTAEYLGPEGSVMRTTNGMNCQNCHLEAGTKHFGNNFSSVASTYPKFRARSGGMESIEKRVNDCLERSLNGVALDTTAREMKALVGYIRWVGSGVAGGETVQGSSLPKLGWLSRPADSLAGQQLYALKCQVCHGADGEGQRDPGGKFIYPPMWGDHSFNTGAGLFRISNFSGYVFANMPVGATFDTPLLSEEEAWDIAAYVLSKKRPFKNFSQDWPEVRSKPIDHPFGPYADEFSEEQHKYGPFGSIASANQK